MPTRFAAGNQGTARDFAAQLTSTLVPLQRDVNRTNLQAAQILRQKRDMIMALLQEHRQRRDAKKAADKAGKGPSGFGALGGAGLGATIGGLGLIGAGGPVGLAIGAGLGGLAGGTIEGAFTGGGGNAGQAIAQGSSLFMDWRRQQAGAFELNTFVGPPAP